MFGLHVGLPLTCLVSHEASKVVRSLESGESQTVLSHHVGTDGGN